MTVTGDEYHASFDVSGRVISPDGEPVAGAVVLLRESSTQRVSAEHAKYKDDPLARETLRLSDVFARTVTDQDGTYRFENAKAPILPGNWNNTWKGDVVAAHESFGVGWLPLGDKQERSRVETGLDIKMRKGTSIKGTFVDPSGKPLGGIPIRLYRLDSLVGLERSPLSRTMFDLQASQLTLLATTDSSGSFGFSGVPEEMVAMLISQTTNDWMMSFAAVATSTQPTSPWRSQYGEEPTVLSSPFRMEADPGLIIRGKVADDGGGPIANASISLSNSTNRFPTDAAGDFEMKLSRRTLDRRSNDQSTTISFIVRAAEDSSYLPRFINVERTDIESSKPMTIELEKGVQVTGKVMLEDGSPVANVVVRQVTQDRYGLLSTVTDEAGKYSLHLPRGPQTLLFGTDEPGLSLPTGRELYSITTDQAKNVPSRKIDLSDGKPQSLEPIIVQRIEAIQVRVQFQDGTPAAGATLVLKDREPDRNPNPSFTRPPRFRDRSDFAEADQKGIASLIPQGAITDEGYVECKLSTSDRSYHGKAKVSDAVDGIVEITLDSSWIVTGRVLIDESPLPGVRVSIGQSRPIAPASPFGGRMPGGSTVSNFQSTVTDANGIYRVAVEPDEEYSVMITAMPDGRMGPGLGSRPEMTSNGVLKVKDFAFSNGSHAIAGVVVDGEGKPIPGARVYVARTSEARPDFWLGHQSESQMETDASGRFQLKRMPAGRYRLHISGPRIDGQRPSSSMVEANTGETDRVIVIDSRPRPAPPRLQPKRVTEIPNP